MTSSYDKGALRRSGGVTSDVSVARVLERRSGLTFEAKSVNLMPDVPRFLGTWMNPDARRTPAVLAVSSLGNINRVGRAGVQEADDLDPLHPSWQAALEPAVAPLVNWFAMEQGFVTYDSCQGHEDQDVPALRLGILPRTVEEAVAVGSVLTRMKAAPHSEGTRAAYSTRAFASSLSCHCTGGRYLTLEYEARAARGTGWETFRDHRGALVDELMHLLAAAR